ncbi:MAG: sugar ABC transporter substrate-binding protein [Candidatus Humimicrobiaceae bacterium]
MSLKKISIIIAVLVFATALFVGCKTTSTATTVATETTAEAATTTTAATAETTTTAAAVSENPKNKKGETVKMASIEFLQFPCYQNRDKAAAKAAADYGIDRTVIGVTEVTVEAYITALTNAINQGFDAITCEPWVTDPFKQPLKAAKDKGIPIFIVHVPFPDDSMFESWVGIDNDAYGKTAAKILNDNTGGKANILFMMTNPDVANQATIKKSFEAALPPDMKIVATEFTEADAIKASEKLSAAFRTYKDINVVMFVESGGVTVAAKVAKDMKLLDKLTILGVDDPPDEIEAIKNGEIWGSMNQNFQKQGYESVRNIADYFLGNPFPKKTDAGIVLITKENVDTYLDDMWKPIAIKGTPYPNL